MMRALGLLLLGCAVSCGAGWICFLGIGSLMNLAPETFGIKGPFGFLPTLALYGSSFVAAFAGSAWALQRRSPPERRMPASRILLLAGGAGAGLGLAYVAVFAVSRTEAGAFLSPLLRGLLERPWLLLASWILAWNVWAAWRAGRP